MIERIATFLTSRPVSSENTMLVSMAEVVALDPTVLEVGRISPSLTATRESVDDKRRKHSQDRELAK